MTNSGNDFPGFRQRANIPNLKINPKFLQKKKMSQLSHFPKQMTKKKGHSQKTSTGTC